MSNHSTKRDGKHREVDLALRIDGWRTWDTHAIGGSWPDIVASKPGINLLVEVKSPGGKLSEGQEVFFRTWPGPKIVAYGGQDAVEKARKVLEERQAA